MRIDKGGLGGLYISCIGLPLAVFCLLHDGVRYGNESKCGTRVRVCIYSNFNLIGQEHVLRLQGEHKTYKPVQPVYDYYSL